MIEETFVMSSPALTKPQAPLVAQFANSKSMACTTFLRCGLLSRNKLPADRSVGLTAGLREIRILQNPSALRARLVATSVVSDLLAR